MSTNEKIECVRRYYGISHAAALYIYHRRRRSYPWFKKSDAQYLYWNAKLQNALIAADSILNFDWGQMEYGNEEEYLALYGVDVRGQSNNLFRNGAPVAARVLQECGLLPEIMGRAKKAAAPGIMFKRQHTVSSRA